MPIETEDSAVHEIVVMMEKIRILRKEALVEMKFASDFVARDLLTGLRHSNLLDETHYGSLMLVEIIGENVDELVMRTD